jgi:hypothetical protein
LGLKAAVVADLSIDSNSEQKVGETGFQTSYLQTIACLDQKGYTI